MSVLSQLVRMAEEDMWWTDMPANPPIIFFGVEYRRNTSLSAFPFHHADIAYPGHLSRAEVADMICGIRWSDAPRWFALMVLLSDGYLRPHPGSGRERHLRRLRRWAAIVVLLPMELQMVLARRMDGLDGDIVLSGDTERYFRNFLGGDWFIPTPSPPDLLASLQFERHTTRQPSRKELTKDDKKQIARTQRAMKRGR